MWTRIGAKPSGSQNVGELLSSATLRVMSEIGVMLVHVIPLTYHPNG
jgi:hypothetical protein